jgi:hypothetical protein
VPDEPVAGFDNKPESLVDSVLPKNENFAKVGSPSDGREENLVHCR